MTGSGNDNGSDKRCNWPRLFIIPAVAAFLAAVAMYFFVSAYVMNKAEESIQNIILSHRGVHHYIQRVMHPAFYRARNAGEIPQNFYTPEILSSSFIVRVMHGFYNEERFKAGLPPVYYKLASDNPRNPVNRADEFEMSLIRMFNERQDLKEYRRVMNIDGNKFLYYAIPFLETTNVCTRCHGRRSDAPPGLQRIYSGSGGFNEQTGRIRAIESIRAPIGDEMSVIVITVSSLAAFVFVGLILFGFNRRLSREVRDRTIELEKEIKVRLISEGELRQSRNMLANIIESIPQAVFWKNCEGVYLGCNNVFAKAAGFDDSSGVIGKTDYDLPWPVDDADAYRSDDREVMASNRPKRHIWEQLQVPDGHRIVIDTTKVPLADESGNIGILGIFDDITERNRLENELVERENKFRTVCDWTQDWEYWEEPSGALRYISPSSIDITGYSAEEFRADPELLLRIVHPEDRLSVKDHHFQVFEGQDIDAHQDEFRIIKRSGEIRWIHHVCRQVFSGGENLGRRVSNRDITDRKHAEEEQKMLELQLLHAQKLESLGVLAGGIAHDFNNILTAVIGNVELAMLHLNHESPVMENLQRIEKAASRAADLARQMLAYSGRGKFVIEALDLNRILEDMGHMLEISISKKAILRYDLAKSLPVVDADATQIRQIIMNLVINASEAIGDRSGAIAISTGSLECDEKFLQGTWQIDQVKEGFYVYLEVADTGCGMDEETRSKIFDPFFTTKFTGRGLGMAAVLGIVRGHKGAIKVCSEPGKGSSFKVLLPASDKPAERCNGEIEKDDWKAVGKVLLVDDEETVRGIGAEMLKELGFIPITAQDGREALEIIRNTPDIAIVILDLTMPHIDGEQCFNELRLLKPDLKVIMSSGFSESEVTQKFAGKGLAGFIQKPYKLSMLRDSIKGLVN